MKDMTERGQRNGSLAQLDIASSVPASEEQSALKGRNTDARPELGRTNSSSTSLDIATPSGGRTRETGNKTTRPLEDATNYRKFRLICDQLVNEVNSINDYLTVDEVSDEGLEVVVEIEHLVEQLYDCPWGEGESLKRVIVAIQSQVNNISWTRHHVEFLKDIARFLRAHYLIDETTVDACYDMLKSRNLDPFRGTVSEPLVIKKYQIQEVKDA